LHFVPEFRVQEVRNKNPSFRVTVLLGVQREKQLGRKLPEAVSAKVVSRQYMQDLSARYAHGRNIVKCLGSVVYVFQAASVKHRVVRQVGLELVVHVFDIGGILVGGIVVAVHTACTEALAEQVLAQGAEIPGSLKAELTLQHERANIQRLASNRCNPSQGLFAVCVSEEVQRMDIDSQFVSP
jgi:hypothetical protein